MYKSGCEQIKGKSRICRQTTTTFCLLRRQVFGKASVTVRTLLLLCESLFGPLGRLESPSNWHTQIGPPCIGLACNQSQRSQPGSQLGNFVPFVSIFGALQFCVQTTHRVSAAEATKGSYRLMHSLLQGIRSSLDIPTIKHSCSRYAYHLLIYCSHVNCTKSLQVLTSIWVHQI